MRHLMLIRIVTGTSIDQRFYLNLFNSINMQNTPNIYHSCIPLSIKMYNSKNVYLSQRFQTFESILEFL